MNDQGDSDKPGTSDDFLMGRAAAGDTEAFGRIVTAYQPRLTRFAERMLGGDAEAARDIAQEAFLRLWRNRERYEPQGELERYLLRTVHNLCRDDRRRRARFRGPTIALEDCGTLGDTRSLPPHEAMQAHSLSEAVRVAVGCLPEPQRAVFVLSHYEGLGYQEIADALGCPIGTVASRKHLAVAALRHALREWITPQKG